MGRSLWQGSIQHCYGRGHHYVVILIVFKASWDFLVPTLFPLAVEQGLVVGSISWGTALYIVGAVTLVAAFVRWTGASWFGSDNTRIAVIEVKLNAIATHLGIDPNSALKAEVASLARAGKKVEAVALYRSHTGEDLASATAYVDRLGSSETEGASPDRSGG